jgi:hypothetical protein
MKLLRKVRTVCGRVEEVDWEVEGVVLELLGVEEICDVEAEVEAEVELEVVEDSTGGVELVDWTEEEVLNCVGLLDVRDSERAVDGTGVEGRDEPK